MNYSYVRVSTDKQDFLRQEKAINDWCTENGVVIDRAFEDKITGKTFHRPEYEEMKETVRSGDAIIVKELDRIGRDWDGIKAEWKWFSDNDINIIVIDMPLLAKSIYDGDGKVDLNMKFIKSIVFETLCYVSETERVKNSRRTREKLQALKEQGIVLGRPIDPDREQQIKEMYLSGVAKVDIAFQLDTSRTQIDRVLKRLKERGELQEEAQQKEKNLIEF